ncbi:MAG: DUF4097 family beta strand repeat-containing protein [Acidimicrobiales bacterium]
MTAVGAPVAVPAAPLGAGSRRAWTAVGLVLAVAAVAIWTGYIVVRQFHASYATLPVVQRTFRAPVHHVVLSVEVGTVVIETGPTASAVVQTSGTRTVRTPTDHEAVTGGTLHIRSTCGAKTADAFYCRRNYVVRVPSGDSVVGTDGTGNLQISGVAGPVQARAMTGGLFISQSRGTVQATADTGPIAVDGARGPLSLRAVNGSITVRGATTRVEMSSGTGNLTAVDLSAATVSAAAVNGSVSLAFQTAPEHVTASTQTGGVTVLVPPVAPSYRLELSSTTGSVTTGLTNDPTGTRTIRATSAAGSVDVSDAGPVPPVHPSPPSAG